MTDPNLGAAEATKVTQTFLEAQFGQPSGRTGFESFSRPNDATGPADKPVGQTVTRTPRNPELNKGGVWNLSQSPRVNIIHGEPGPGMTPEILKGVQRLADKTGQKIWVTGSRQTGVSFHTGQPFKPDADIDIGVVGNYEQWAIVQQAEPQATIGWKTDFLGQFDTIGDIPPGLSVFVVAPN